MSAELAQIPTYEAMAESIDEAAWEWLRPHLLRDVLILVESDLDLVETGLALAADNAEQVRTWVDSGKIGKPLPEQIAYWDTSPEEQKFILLIVAPYLLIQEIPRIMQ